MNSTHTLRVRVESALNRFVDVTGTPVLKLAAVVETLAMALILSGIAVPTHAFEVSHASLFFATHVLKHLLKRRHTAIR